MPESVLEPLTAVSAVMKPVQSMPLSMTLGHQYDDPGSKYESLGLGEAVKLSPTSYLDVGVVRHNLLRGGNSASGMSSLRSTGGGMNNEAGSGGSGDDSNDNDAGTGSGNGDDGRGSSDGDGNGNDTGTGGGNGGDGRGGSGGEGI
ncbi:hypothetical protein Tco_1556847 [Tanacetum coccineum]